MRVLVTDAGSKNALAVVRDLVKSGHVVHTLGARRSLANWSRAVSESHDLSAGVSFGELVAPLVSDKGIDCIVPVGAESTFALEGLRSELEGVVGFALAPPAAMRLASSKKNVQDFAESHGLFVPKSEVFESYGDFITTVLRYPLPFVVKPDSHLSPHAPLYVLTESDRDRFIRLEFGASMFLHGQVQVQEYIGGHGEGFFALYSEGACVRQMMHKRLGETPESGGSSWAARSTYEPDVEFYGQQLLTLMKWHGPAMVEFKRRASDGQLFLMELNPKLWGSLDLTIAAGVRIPSDLVELAAGGQLKKNLDYATEVLFWWPLDSWGSLFGRNRLRSFGNVITNVDLRDFGPAVAGIASLLRKILLNLLRIVGVRRVVAWWAHSGPALAFSRITDEVLGLPLRKNCEIDDFLWVGARPRLLGRVFLKKIFRRTPVSLLRGDLPGVFPSKSKNTVVPITEFVEIPQSDFLAAISLLEKLREDGERAFVHCREGVGRAPSVAAAYLIYRGAPLSAALDKVTAGRRVTKINFLQKASLVRFERSLRGENPE